VCDGCGLVIDLPVTARPAARAAKVPPGFAVRAVEQIVRGRCAACSDDAAH
jgi:Fe2+ or Zn2+ uptake regulation protein